MRRAKMHDDLAHETKPDQLDAEGHEQHRQEQSRAVGNPLTLDPLDEEHQAQDGTYPDEQRTD
jgi:hypothetical protein